MPSRRLLLNHLSEEECEHILAVIQRDFSLRQLERDRLSKIEEEIKEEDTKTTILSKKEQFNENCCMRCFSRFFFVFNQKVQCHHCKFFICKNCSDYDKTKKEYVCHVCQKQRELHVQSNEWFYNNVKQKFKRFGSAKVVRSLYRRRTDSDSENDFQPQQYNSLPIGKRTRGSMDSLFKEGEGYSYNKRSSLGVEEDIVVQDRVDRIYKTPYSCPVSFSQAKEEEVVRFRGQLNNIVEDISTLLEERDNLETEEDQTDREESANRMESEGKGRHPWAFSLLYGRKGSLERWYYFPGTMLLVHSRGGQAPEGFLLTKPLMASSPKRGRSMSLQWRDTEDEDDRLLENHRLQVSSALSSLAQSLHIAVDNQDVSELQQLQLTSDPACSPTFKLSSDPNVARHQLVRQVLAQEVHSFTGQQLDLGEENTSDYSSENSSSSKTSDSQNKHLEDLLTEAIFKKILADHNKKVEEGFEKEEKALNHELRKLSNKVTVSQLNEVLSDTETDLTSAVSNLDDTVSDGESRLSEDYSSRQLNGDVVDMGPIQKEAIDKEWQFVESRKSPFLTCEANGDRSPWQRVEGQMSVEEEQEIKDMKEHFSSAKPIPIARDVDEVVYDSDDTLANESPMGTPVNEPLLEKVVITKKNEVVNENGVGEDDVDNPLAFDFLIKKQERIPLPSFTVDGHLRGLDEVDTDDISHHGYDGEEEDDDNHSVTTFSSEITFGSNWESGGLFDNDAISAYDNFGEKKVGRDSDVPVYMCIPKAADSTTKIGDQTLDELSDLSENEAKSDVSLEDSDEDDDSEGGVYYEKVAKRARKALEESLADEGCQTDDLEAYIQAQQEAEARRQEAELRKKAEEKRRKALEMPAISTIGQETDPKFVVRPRDVTILEGEVLKLECQVDGTSPLDVFWYKDMAEVDQLEDGERCDLTYVDTSGKFLAEVYNTTKADSGHYLCIGINELGQCTQSFKVIVKDNTNEKTAPEFLRKLSDLEAIVGDSIKLRCKVKGYPHPRVLWYKDGQRINTSDECKIEKFGNRDYVVSMDYVTLDDDAEYTVVASNVAGECRCSMQLIVEPAQHELEPVQRSLSQPDRLNKASTENLQTSVYNTSTYEYPDTDELLRIAQQISQSREDVDKTATKMLRSAYTMSQLNDELDKMDKSLDEMETKVASSHTDNENNNTLDYIYDAQALVDEEEDLHSAAKSVRAVTNSALDLLTSADQVIASEHQSQGSKQEPMEIVITKTDGESSEEEADVHFTFDEFEKLYSAGKVTREQMRQGKIKKKDLKSIKEYLALEKSYEEEVSHDLVVEEEFSSSIDCGLKRVDSKRYKRDYVIRKDSPQTSLRRWEVHTSSSNPRAQLVKATPAGLREDPLAEMDYPAHDEQDAMVERNLQATSQTEHEPVWSQSKAEEEIYLQAGHVFSLEERVRQLESDVKVMDEDAVSQEHLAKLEKEVARTAAQVEHSDKQVSHIERQVDSMSQKMQISPTSPLTVNTFFPEQSNNQTRYSTQSDSAISTSYDNGSSDTSPIVEHSQSELRSPGSHSDNISLSVAAVLSESADEPLELPSVKHLMSMFSQEDPQTDSSVKRVYSLTGRDLPKTVREKLKQQGPGAAPNPNIKPDFSVKNQRPAIVEIFDQTDSFRTSTPAQLHSPRAEVTKTLSPPSPVSKASHNRSVMNTTVASEPVKKVIGSVKATEDVPQKKELKIQTVQATQSLKSPPLPTSQPPPMPKERRKSSTIMARAAFWDSRINQGDSTDGTVINEFPDMPAETFKDEEHRDEEDDLVLDDSTLVFFDI